VTSGTQSPTLGKPIAMAYVAPRDAEPGTILAVEIRGQPVAAEVVSLPFYKRVLRPMASGASPRSSESSSPSS
jgi:glycine cleavage system T protein (aminomethyltransferase)